MTIRNPSLSSGTPGSGTPSGGPVLFPDEPEVPDEPFLIPGTPGVPGIPGAPGETINSFVFLPPDAPDAPDEPMIVPGPTGATGAPGAPGGGDPFKGSYAPGGFVLATGKYVVMGGRLELAAGQEVQLDGDSILVII